MCVCNALVTVVCATGFSKAGLPITGTACPIYHVKCGAEALRDVQQQHLVSRQEGLQIGLNRIT